MSDPLAPFSLALDTRGYDIDPTGTVGMAVVFRYFEHKRWTMMRDPRLGLVDLVHGGHFFVVRSQTVELVRHVGQGVALDLETRFVGAGRSVATVHHAARRASDGALVAQARVRGVWIGPNRRMARLPDAFRAFARAQADATPPSTDDAEGSRSTAGTDATAAATSFFDPPVITRASMGVDVDADAHDLVPPRGAYVHPITVPPRDLDVFSHVNAATWLRYAEDARTLGARAGALPEDLGASSYNVRSALLYLHEAVEGDDLRVHAWPIEDRVLAVAITREGSPDRLVCARVDVAPGARPIAPAPDAGPDATRPRR